MAAVDSLSLDAGDGGQNWKRWALAGAAALALHAGVIAVIRQSPPDSVEFGEDAAIEMDLTPPPSGEAQLQDAGANATQAEQPEQLEEVQDQETPPEDPPDAVEAAPVEDVQEAQPVETPEVAADDVKTPDDVQAAVSLPPERTVVAQEERPPEPKKEPVKEPVVKKPPPKREPVKDAKPAERPVAKPKAVATVAGGQSGAASSSGAASAAAASTYGSRVRAAVAAQKRSGTTFVGRATVTFTLNRSGRVGGVSASGPPAAAAEAAAMVRRASFPPMPAEMQGASKSYTLPVSFSMR